MMTPESKPRGAFGRHPLEGDDMRRLCTILTLTSLCLLGCDRADKKPEDAKPAAGAAAEAPPARPAPRGPVTITRSDPESAAASIRELAGRETSLTYLDAWIDPSQSAASGLVGPTLMQLARHAQLMDVAREKFGDEGADVAARVQDSFSVDLGNGLAEMFEADHFEEVRRDGGRAYVMANLADGQPIGAPIVFKDNQGDWLLLLCNGDEPWSASRIGTMMSALGGAMGHGDKRAAVIDQMIAGVRDGSIQSASQLAEAIDRLNNPVPN